MGLDYSIQTYVKEEHLTDCLKWLKQHSYDFQNQSFTIVANKEVHSVIGGYVKIYKDDELIDGKNFLNSNGHYEHVNSLHFDTNLIFDIDPKLIASIGDWTLDWNSFFLDDFINDFQEAYLGNGKIQIGNFNSSISKLKDLPIYKLKFTAVTSWMSEMLEESQSVKKWMKEWSLASHSILTFLDLESAGQHIICYKDTEMDLHIKGNISYEYSEPILDLLVDLYNLEGNNTLSAKLDNALESKTCIIRDKTYELYIEQSDWIVYTKNEIPFQFCLTQQQIQSFRKEGKSVLDKLVEQKIVINKSLNR